MSWDGWIRATIRVPTLYQAHLRSQPKIPFTVFRIHPQIFPKMFFGPLGRIERLDVSRWLATSRVLHRAWTETYHSMLSISVFQAAGGQGSWHVSLKSSSLETYLYLTSWLGSIGLNLFTWVIELYPVGKESHGLSWPLEVEVFFFLPDRYVSIWGKINSPRSNERWYNFFWFHSWTDRCPLSAIWMTCWYFRWPMIDSSFQSSGQIRG